MIDLLLPEKAAGIQPLCSWKGMPWKAQDVYSESSPPRCSRRKVFVFKNTRLFYSRSTARTHTTGRGITSTPIRRSQQGVFMAFLSMVPGEGAARDEGDRIERAQGTARAAQQLVQPAAG